MRGGKGVENNFSDEPKMGKWGAAEDGGKVGGPWAAGPVGVENYRTWGGELGRQEVDVGEMGVDTGCAGAAAVTMTR